MAVVKTVERYDVWLVTLEPAKGSDIRKTRPCLVVSPDEMNAWLRTVLVAPMTTAQRTWPSRVAIRFEKKDGQVALDQLRCIDKNRLVKKLGKAPEPASRKVAETLGEMFTF